jgi:hypothetical protein
MTQPRKRTAGSTGARTTARKRSADSDGSDAAPRKRTSAAPRERANATPRERANAAPRKRTGSSETTSSPTARNGRNRALSPVQIARAAAEQLAEISGAGADSVSGLERTEDGWLVRVEVVEVQRIPDSTSVMASYQVVVDDDGMLQSYRRDHRYYRNQAGDS